MGDRVAVLREGGVLAQFATPAELLMAPADEFVEDFVGADRALKRLALLRVADISLWEAPLAYVGQPTAEVRAKLDGAEVPHSLLVDSERRPLGWLSDRDLEREIVPEVPDSPAEPRLERDDVMRDALSDLLQAETQYAAVVDGEGKIAGVLSIEIISEFLGSREALVEEHSAVERPAGDVIHLLAQESDFFTDRSEGSELDCVADNTTVCFGWAADHIDKFVTPTLQHLLLVGVSVAAGFAIALAMAVLSHRRRWLVPTFTGASGVLYTIPSIALFLILLPITNAASRRR